MVWGLVCGAGGSTGDVVQGLGRGDIPEHFMDYGDQGMRFRVYGVQKNWQNAV